MRAGRARRTRAATRRCRRRWPRARSRASRPTSRSSAMRSRASATRTRSSTFPVSPTCSTTASFDIHFDPAGALDVHPGSRPQAHLRRRPRRLPAAMSAAPSIPLGLRLGVHPASRPPSRPRYRLAEAQRLRRSRSGRRRVNELFRDAVGERPMNGRRRSRPEGSRRSRRTARGSSGRRLMLFAAAASCSPAEALAHKCDRTDNDRREASRVIADLTGEIDAMERAIIEALQSPDRTALRLHRPERQGGDRSARLPDEAAGTDRARGGRDRGHAWRTGPAGAPARRSRDSRGLRGHRRRGEASAHGHVRPRPRPGRIIRGPRRGRQAGSRRRRCRPLRDASRGNTATQRRAGEDPELCRGDARACTARTCTPALAVRPPHLRERGRTAGGRGAFAQSRRARGARPAGRSPRPIPTASAGARCWRARRTPARRWPPTTWRRPGRSGRRVPRSANGRRRIAPGAGRDAGDPRQPL